MADSPPDKVANIDVTTLTQYEAAEFRHELLFAIRHPETEFDVDDQDTLSLYRKKVGECDAYLATFPIKIGPN